MLKIQSALAVLAFLTFPLPTIGGELERSVNEIVMAKRAAVVVEFHDKWEIYERTVKVPKQLSKDFVTDKEVVIDKLLKIVEDGKPDDSITAASYIVALLKSGYVATACIDYYDPKKYELVDKLWEETPRCHWTAVVKRLIKESTVAK